MFDYGVPPEQMRSQDNLKVWPKEGERTALVDADAIPYLIGYTSNLQQYLKAKRSACFEETEVWKDKINQANAVLNRWIEQAECDSALLYLTGSKNFRLDVAFTTPYKGQRIQEKPPFYLEMRQWFLDVHSAIMSDCCEADDEISIEAWKRHLAFDSELWTSGHKKFSNFVVVSGDKDLGIIPGWHCPPNGQLLWVDPLGSFDPVWKEKDIVAYEYWPLFKKIPKDLSKCYTGAMHGGRMKVRTKEELECPKDKWELDYVWFYDGKQQDTYVRGKNMGKGKFKRVTVGTKKTGYLHKLKGVGLKFFYSQILTGDPTDNYKGLPGCGEVKAYEALDSAESEMELVSRVRQLYFNEYGEAWKKMLTEQGQLAHMQTRRGELWQLPTKEKGTFPA